MSQLDATVVRRELRALRGLLQEVEPDYAKRVQAVGLGVDASLAEQLYWEEVGFLEGFMPGFQPPNTVDTEAVLATLIERWRSIKARRSHWGPEGATRGALPAKCRVLALRMSRPSVTLVDETGGLEDPPVVYIDKDGERQERGPFLRHVVDTTVARLFAGRYFNAHVPDSLLGAPIMPTLAPHLSKLADGVWHTIPFPERRHASGSSREFVGFTSYRVLVEFLVATADSGWIRNAAPIADRYDLDTVPEALLTSNRLQVIRDARRGTTFRAGTIAGRPVIMLPEGKGESIYVQPEDRDVVVKEAKRHGARGAIVDRMVDLRYDVDGHQFMPSP